MAMTEDIQSWARRQELAPDVTAVLEENGFSTVRDLTLLTPADIKDAFQDSGLLNLAQCLALRRAVTTLTPTTHPHTPPADTWPFSPPPPAPTPPCSPPPAGPLPQSSRPQPRPAPHSFPTQDPQRCSYPHQAPPHYPQQSEACYPPHQSQSYPPRQSQSHPPHQFQSYPPHQSQSYPPHQSQSYPPRQSQSHPPHQSEYYPPQQSQSYPPHHSQSYPPHQSQPQPPQSQSHPSQYQSYPYPPQPQPHPPQKSRPFPPQQSAGTCPTHPHPHAHLHPQPCPEGASLYHSLAGDDPPYPTQYHSRSTRSGHPQPCVLDPGQSSCEVVSPPGAGAMAAECPLYPEGPGEVSEQFRFLLLGKTGSGKSTTGNTIFGEQLFSTAATFESVTSDCERKTNKRGGRNIEILDSPGLYDTHKSPEEIGVVIVQAVAGMHPGPHAILYVVPLGRYTAQEFATYQRLKALFDDTITRYMIVVFTHGDKLEREGLSIGDLIGRSMPQNLQQVLRECNNRYVVFNNMAANRQPQVDHLLQLVRQLVRENGAQPYSCPKYSNIGQGMEEEVARRLEEVEKRDLQRQKYVQQLEQQTKEAEESARRTQEEFQRNEEERQRQMEAEEESRRQLEDQLQNHIKEQQIGFEKYQQELEQLHQEREEQERMMREKEAQMSEMEKKRAEEQAEQMRQREQEMQALLTQQEERLSRQRQEDEERRQEMERERQEFLKRMEEQRQKEIEELEKRNEEREKLWEKQREEEREAAKKKEENYEKEMEELKSQVAANKATDFIHACATAIRNFVHILAEISTGRGPNPNPYYLGQAPRRPITDGRDLFGVPHSDESRMNGEN